MKDEDYIELGKWAVKKRRAQKRLDEANKKIKDILLRDKMNAR